MKKKILALLLSVLLVTLSVSAGWDLEIETGSLWSIGLTLDDVEAVIGQKGVVVDVYIEGNDGLCGGAFVLEFDDEALTLAKEPELVDLAGFEVTGATDLAASPYYTSIAAERAVVGDGVLLRYTFDVNKTAPEGVYEIKLLPAGEGGAQDIPLEFIDANREPIGCNVDFGSITVSPLAGDANSDGEVSNLDATTILQYLVGWDVHINLDAADVDGNEGITTLDAARILQKLVGWEVDFVPPTPAE